jgi:hypothetical protein
MKDNCEHPNAVKHTASTNKKRLHSIDIMSIRKEFTSWMRTLPSEYTPRPVMGEKKIRFQIDSAWTTICYFSLLFI